MLHKLASRKMAILFLILLTLAYIAGMLVPQEHLITKNQFSKWLELNPLWGPIAYKIGITHFFNTWWFIALVLGLFVNTLACTIEQARALIKRNARTLESRNVQSWPNSATVKMDATFMDRLAIILKECGFKITPTSQGLYAHKFKWARWSSVIFHTGLLIVIIGGMTSTLTKTVGMVKITEGQAFTGNAAEYASFQKGYLASTPISPFNMGVDDVQVQGNESREEYASKVVIINEGTVVNQKTVKVNRNLQLAGYTFYMTDYGYSPAVIISRAGQEVFAAYTAVNNNKEADSRIGDFAIGATGWKADIEFIATTLGTPEYSGPGTAIKLKIKDGQTTIFDQTVNFGQNVEQNGIKVEYSDLRKWAEYIVAKDRGANLVFLGGVIALLGLGMLYTVSPKEIVVQSTEEDYQIYGKAQRFKQSFAEEFNELIRR